MSVQHVHFLASRLDWETVWSTQCLDIQLGKVVWFAFLFSIQVALKIKHLIVYNRYCWRDTVETEQCHFAAANQICFSPCHFFWWDITSSLLTFPSQLFMHACIEIPYSCSFLIYNCAAAEYYVRLCTVVIDLATSCCCWSINFQAILYLSMLRIKIGMKNWKVWK